MEALAGLEVSTNNDSAGADASINMVVTRQALLQKKTSPKSSSSDRLALIESMMTY